MRTFGLSSAVLLAAAWLSEGSCPGASKQGPRQVMLAVADWSEVACVGVVVITEKTFGLYDFEIPDKTKNKHSNADKSKTKHSRL